MSTNNLVPHFQMLDYWTEQGMLRKVVSECGNFVLWNYTDAATYSKTWNETTLNARGTVYDIQTGEVVARAYKKFFNIEELPEERQKEILNAGEQDFACFEKVDGSLGILAYYGGKWRISTRGSFTSEQAIRGAEILKKYDNSKLNSSLTYLAEIIYPENKIIVNYGDKEELVLLGAYVTKTGAEVDLRELPEPFPQVKQFNFKSVEEIIETQVNLPWTDEGFVLRLNSGERVKFKSKEYMKIAKIKANMSPLTFWEKMREGTESFKTWNESLPEELRPDADKIIIDLQASFKSVDEAIIERKNQVFGQLFGTIPEITKESKKILGIFLKDNPNKYNGCMWYFLDNNPEALRDYIYKEIRPDGNVIK